MISSGDERFEFLVCSKFNHTQCGCTCACAVARLHPRNSISNVGGVLDDMYSHIFVRDVAKKHETVVEGQRLL